MTDSRLRSLATGAAGRLLWIEFDAYAHRVFAGGRPGWHGDASGYAATLLQANAIVRTDVLSIPAAAAALAALPPRNGGSAADAVRDALAAPAAAAFAAGAVDALAHRLGGRTDLVLTLPPPRALLLACGAGAAEAGDFDALDDVAMAAAGLLRALSDKPVAGLALSFAAPPEEDEIAACDTLVGTARHYGWSVAVLAAYAQDAAEAAVLAPLGPDLTLLPEVPAASLTAPGLGGGLTRQFWEAGAAVDGPRLLHGTIPDGLAAEEVVRRIDGLRAAAAGGAR